MSNLTLGSLFDGISGFPLAASRYGIKPVWASEIERIPIAISKRHFPDMLHLGDITKINGAAIPPVDIITFGSPCQDLSVAGKQAGLEGERSGLFLEAVRIIREMREATHGKLPAIAVWENVPGAFSSRGGADFRRVLSEIAETDVPMPPSGRWARAGMVRGGGVDIAWRVLDAQYWGVPQRRKRIYLVADFRGQRAGAILFKPEGLSRYFGSGKKAGESTAAAATTGAGGADRAVAAGFDVQQITNKDNHAEIRYGAPQPTLCKDGRPHVIYPIHDKATRHQGGGASRNDDGSANGLGIGAVGDPCPTITVADRHAVAAFTAGQGAAAGGIGWGERSAPTLRANGGLTAAPTVCIQGAQIGRADRNGPQGAGYAEDVAFTLDTKEPHAVVIGMDSDFNCMQDKIGTMRAHTSGGAEYAVLEAYRFRGLGDYKQTEIGKTLMACDDITTGDLIRCGYVVRRMTPTECERLQGLPDGWTAGHADTPRYRGIGNGLAIPCAEMVMAGNVREVGTR